MNTIAFFSNWIKPVALVLMLLFSGQLFGKGGQQSIFDLMNYREVLDVTLETDFTYLKNNRRSEDYHPARFTFKDQNGKKQTWDIKVKIRGAFRRIHCAEMPPLKLNFKKSELKAAGLADFDDLKLVSYCMGNEDIASDALFREYLTYKLFNAVTDQSFRVQLLRINYKDTQTGQRTRQWAFLIEDAAQLRERTGAEKFDDSKAYNLPAEGFDRDYLKTVAVFQYMVGNVDWSLSSGKNLKYLRKQDKIIAVPYDFDYTGLVNAPYFAPDSDFGMTSRNERIFLGFPEDVDDLHAANKSIVGKRQLLEGIIKNFKLLSPASRKDMLAFLGSYFDNPDIRLRSENNLAKPVNSNLQLQD